MPRSTMGSAFAAGPALPRALRSRISTRCPTMRTSDRIGVANIRAIPYRTQQQKQQQQQQQQQDQQYIASVEASPTPAVAIPPSSMGPLSRTGGALAVAMAALVALMQRARKGDDDGDLKKSLSSPMQMSVAGNGASLPKPTLGQRLRGLIPPENERKKLLPLGLMFFVILFNYTILRDTKDVLVVTSAGAEIIPFLKTYCNLPGAVLFTIAYSKMSNAFSRETLFYVCIVPFVLFFLAFGYLMYPNLALLHPTAFVTSIASQLPAGFAAPLAIIKNWTFALFYTLAELWGSVVVSLLFWGFANEVTTVDEAKKYYPLFGLMANVALIFSGQYVRFVSDIRANLPPGVDGWAISLKYLMSMIAVGGGVIIGCYYYMQRKIVSDPKLVDPTKQKKAKTKTKLSLGDSVKYLAGSSYIRNLAMLVIAYGMSINIVEVTWKSKLRAAYPDPNEYSAFMGNFSTATGTVTFGMMLAGRFIFRRFGWGVAAYITPVVLGITGFIFFSLTLFSTQLSPFIAALGTTPLLAAVFIGAAQNILSKSAKYSLFDPCKEMAYIPLDAEQKSKGKAAIDVIGNPLGKSGGSFIQQILIFSLGSLAACTPYLAIILFAVIGLWLTSARSLDKQFSAYMMAETKKAAEAKAQESQSVKESSASASAFWHTNLEMVKSIPALLRLGLSPRILGFDDAPFCTRPRIPNANVNFVGIMTSADRFEGMLYCDGLLQDGLNGGTAIAQAVTGSKFHEQIHAVFIDGITMGGLNVIDIEALADDIKRPVIAVMRRPPNVTSIIEACSNLPEYEERTRRILAAGPIHESGGWIFQFRCPSGTIDAPSVEQVASLLQRCTPGEEQKIPECLRLAHLIGAAVKTGQSSSNA